MGGGRQCHKLCCVPVEVSTYVSKDAHFFGQALGGVQANGGGVSQSHREGVHILSQSEAGLPRLRDTTQ